MPFNQKECLSSEGRDMSPKPGCVLIFQSVWDMCHKIEGRLRKFASSHIASGAMQPFSATLAMYFTDGNRSERVGLSREFYWIFSAYHIPFQGHHQLSVKSDENSLFQPNQIAASIYIMIELCYFSLDQWEIRIHLLWEKCFNIPHHCDPHSNQTKWFNF